MIANYASLEPLFELYNLIHRRLGVVKVVCEHHFFYYR
jgi:hypothetical protein